MTISAFANLSIAKVKRAERAANASDAAAMPDKDFRDESDNENRVGQIKAL